MKLVSAEEMKRIDRTAIEEWGIPSLTLMENAGAQCLEAFRHLDPQWKAKSVFLFCGRGNNGGDGLVLARLLKENGVLVAAALVGDGELTPEASQNLLQAEKSGVKVFRTAKTQDLADLRERAESCSLVVDALLGTGSQGAPRGLIAEAVRFLNSLNKPIVAIDMPTGVDATTGAVPGEAVRAHQTITLGLPKRGALLFPGTQYVGTLHVVEIGFPLDLLTDSRLPGHLPQPLEIIRLLPGRPLTAHKKMFAVGMAAGSKGMTGAAVLAARSCARTGAGYVHQAAPASLSAVIDSGFLEGVTFPVEDRGAGCFGPKSVESVLEHTKGMKAFLLGPGVGRSAATEEFCREIIKRVPCPLVIDADGLFHLSKDLSCIKNRPAETILTPHAGEMARLTGMSVEAVESDRIGTALAFAKKHNVILLLKGFRTVIAAPDGTFWLNPTGNPVLSTAGTGDVLSGMIAAFLAQGLAGALSAVVGAYVHGFIADRWVMERGRFGLIASDLIEEIPRALQALESLGENSKDQSNTKPSEGGSS